MNIKVIGLIVLLILLVIFAVQNTQPVTVNFLFWQASTSAVVSILLSFLVGCLVGWLIHFIKPGAKKDTIQM